MVSVDSGKIIAEAKLYASQAATWADLSNALFDPIDGLVAKAYPTIEQRKYFRGTEAYHVLQSLVEEAMRKSGVVAGATPQKSGKFVVRLPRSLHAALEREAEEESVSLNQLVVAKLACRLDSASGNSIGTVVQAYLEVRRGYSSDRVVADPELNRRFLNRCRELGATGTDAELNWALFNARKAKQLTELPTKTKTFRVRDTDEFEFASEIGIQYVKREHFRRCGQETTVDRIICDPDLAAEFDRVASQIAPGFTPLQYRWTALGIRKAGRRAKAVGQLELPTFDSLGLTDSVGVGSVPQVAGLYLFEARERVAYVAQTSDLRHRIERHLKTSDCLGLPRWLFDSDVPRLRLLIAPLPEASMTNRRALELQAVKAFEPEWNISRVA